METGLVRPGEEPGERRIEVKPDVRLAERSIAEMAESVPGES
jgi:hypothetical protein